MKEQGSTQSKQKVKIDSRIKTLIENNVKKRTRTLLVIVGENARQHVMHTHMMLETARIGAPSNILWCYKRELGFIADNRARMKRIKQKYKNMTKSLISKTKKENEEQNISNKRLKKKITKALPKEIEDILSDPFHMWLSSTKITYAFFKDSHRVLGTTNSMLVLQDFEAMTPNILARTIETVEGGGVICLLLPQMDSLRKLCSMTMDVHTRFRSKEEEVIVPRFNERFLLSLSACDSCLVVDDSLQVLPISSQVANIKPLEYDLDDQAEKSYVMTQDEKELIQLKEEVKDAQPLGALLAQCKTLDQAKAVTTFIESISEKTLQTTVSCTAGRGRGKSASLGLAIAAAIYYGYANIFVTSPAPENLATLFEFVLKGFDALGLVEGSHYDIEKSGAKHQSTILRINVTKDHRQTVQYIEPQDANHLGQAELLVIDEAAAIPLPIVKKLFGNYLIFFSSTINGYEGTGRSLSLKLMKDLKQRQRQKKLKGRQFLEVELDVPIRYAPGDSIEKWLYELLCLDATIARPLTVVDHPDDCALYYVNRDTLFSFHDASEQFLHKLMTLFVSSHYKNTPNDLQMLSDAANHHIFVLLGKIDENTTSLPEVYCAIQVAIEGKIDPDIAAANMARGKAPSGDLIPYVVSRQYQEPEFSSFQGARVVRIATHPMCQSGGYGTKALNELIKYYQGEYVTMGDDEDNEEDEAMVDDQQPSSLQSETIAPRPQSQLPPLLSELDDRAPEKLHYLGVSYGLTTPLYRFWKRSGFLPVYIRLTESSLTGEHSCIMIRELKNTVSVARTWLQQFTKDFQNRFVSLLSYGFDKLPVGLALSILDYQKTFDVKHELSYREMDAHLTTFDFKRLVSYSNNMLDYHVIVDMLPILARFYFMKRIPLALNYTQASILIGMGLQRKSVSQLCSELDIESHQILAFFNKCMKKVVAHLSNVSKLRHADEAIKKQPSSRKAISKEPSKEDVMVDEEEKGEDELDAIFGDAPVRPRQDAAADQQQVETLQPPTKKVKKNSKFINELIQDDTLKMTQAPNLSAAQSLNKSDEKVVKIKAHMLKSNKELRRDQKEEQSKYFKKNGKRRRIKQ